MAAISKANVKVIFGAMTIGKPGIEMTRVHTLEETKAMIDMFQKYGHNEVDTARVYGQGSSEEYLGAIDCAKSGIKIATKLYPTALRPALSTELYHHSPADLRRGLMASLKALQIEKIDLWYLHAPDRSIPLEDTLREVNKLYEEGLFERWGMSNFQSWEVARVCELCIQNNWQRPSVIQGLYNAFHRIVEAELFRCVRQYGLSFYNFNPLAGGLLTDRYHRDQTEFEDGSRFDPKTNQGKLHRNRYFDESNFVALEILRPVAAKYRISESECALRWLSYHSLLNKENGDGIVIGASSLKHLRENLEALEKGPLTEDIVNALDAGWEHIRGKELKYYH